MTSHPHNPASRRWHATHLPLVGLVSLAVLVGACLRTDFATPGGTAGTETETDTSTTAVDTDASVMPGKIRCAQSENCADDAPEMGR